MQQSIDTYNFKGKRALIRVDFNVPLDNELKVTDDTRIRAAIPTILKVIGDGGVAILMSHMGRPKGVDTTLSLRNILYKVEELLGQPVEFAEDCQRAQAEVSGLLMGEVLLLENLRFYAEEVGKPRLAEGVTQAEIERAKAEMEQSQKTFVRTLASYGDCYINDAFGTAHRAHSSTTLIAGEFPNDKMFGYLMERELQALDAVVKSVNRPFTAIVGGAKVSSKISIIESLIGQVDNLIICGGMTYTFEAAMGGEVGDSLCERDQFETALNIVKVAKVKNVALYFAEDNLCGDSFSNESEIRIYPTNKIPAGWMGLDIGPETEEVFAQVIHSSKTILWNGPAGVFEMTNFAGGSKAVGQAVVKATAHGAYSLVGGGDTVECVNQFGIADKVSYVSTGGGALLEYIEGKTLPGVAAIRG